MRMAESWQQKNSHAAKVCHVGILLLLYKFTEKYMNLSSTDNRMYAIPLEACIFREMAFFSVLEYVLNVGGKVILPSLGKDFFTSVGKQFFT